MKLKDCACGGIPKVTYKLNDKIEFEVGCTACSNRTPVCRQLRDAVSLWNQTYWGVMQSYELESA
jgi:hypothetical protein